MSLYGLILGICFTLGIWYFQKHNKVIPKNRENIFIFGTIVSALIGARLYHVVDYWSYYSSNTDQILATWNGGLAIYGGLTAAVIFITIYSWIYKQKIFPILDTIVPIIPLTQSIGRLGNYFNRENPLWWQESLLNLLLFFVLVKAPKRFSPTALYLIGYGAIRFFTEFYRTDTWVVGSLKIAHIISIIFVIIGSIILLKSRNVKISA